MAAVFARFGRRAIAGGVFAAGAAMATTSYMRDSRRTVECGRNFDNSAFVFIKPHANTKATQELVAKTLAAKGIKIIKVSPKIHYILEYPCI
jgi:hypothetical protein